MNRTCLPRKVLAALALILTAFQTAHTQASPPIDHATRILNLLREEKFADVTAEFNAQMAAALPAQVLGQVWTGLKGQAGEFKSVIDQNVANPTPAITAVTLGCQFERIALNMIVAFDADNKIAGLRFVPRPSEAAQLSPSSDRFKEEPVMVGSGTWALPATLSLPVGNDAVPGVVLVHGSGPNDRDETIGPNKPFRDLAWGLAERGIAVLRYEKRTKEHAGEFAKIRNFTVREETVEDAILAGGVLLGHPGIDHTRVFILGHSLGGTVAPLIGAGDKRIAGLVIMAGATRPLPELVIEQSEYLASLSADPAAQKPAIENLKRQAARVMDPALPLNTPASETMLGAPASYWKHINAYHPAQTAAGLPIPMLILQGERDYQVTLKDLQGWRDALHERNNVTIKSYPDLNHLFMSGQGKSTPLDYERPGRIPDYVLDDIAMWIKQTPQVNPSNK